MEPFGCPRRALDLMRAITVLLFFRWDSTATQNQRQRHENHFAKFFKLQSVSSYFQQNFKKIHPKGLNPAVGVQDCALTTMCENLVSKMV